MNTLLKIVIVLLAILVAIKLLPFLLALLAVATAGCAVFLLLALVASPIWVPVAVVVALCRRSAA